MFKLTRKLQGFPSIPLLSIVSESNVTSSVLVPVLSTYIQYRNTFILKRRYPTKLYKKGIDRIRLKGKDYVYDFVEDTDVTKKPDVQVILKKYVEGLGERGDVVTVKRRVAYNELLVTGLADYATPEAIEKAKLQKENAINKLETFSSITAIQTVRYLENQVLSVVVNKETAWTVRPWHVRVSFRKAGIHVPDHCILLPEKPIRGPDILLEGKEFCITVIINNKEKANVRCRLHHWSTNPGDRLPHVKNHWMLKSETIFPEDAAKLSKLLLPSTSGNKTNDVSNI